MKKIILSLLFYILGGIGVSLSIIPAIGIDPFDSLVVSLSEFSGIKVGTVNFAMNIFFLTVFIIISKGKYKSKYFLMFLSIVTFGWIINIFTYNVFGRLPLNTYIMRLCCYIIGQIVTAISIAVVLFLNVIPFSIESNCLEISILTEKPFAPIRYGFDAICLVLSIIISIFGHTALNVREGTVISLVIFSGVLSLVLNFLNRHFNSKKSVS